MRKIFLLAILISIMSISLTGCKQTSNNLDISDDIVAEDSVEASTEEPEEKPNKLVVGMRLGEALDLTAYNEIVDESMSSEDVLINLKDVLPFESYVVSEEQGLISTYKYYHEATYGESEHSIMSDSILGYNDSVMIIKMNDSDTYAFLIRDAREISWTCSYSDLDNYMIVAIDLSQEDVEEMILPGDDDIIYEYFVDLMTQYRMISKEVDMLSEYIASQSGTPRYFFYNNSTYKLEELSESNLSQLATSGSVFVYYGNSPIPMPHEFLVHVDIYFDESSIKSYSYSRLIEEIQTYAVVIPESEAIVDDGFSSFDIPPVAEQDIIDQLIADGYPVDQLDFSYGEWIDASNFPDDICTDVGLLWILSLINDEIGGDLLTRGKILNEQELLRELNVATLPHTDMVGIINHDTLNYCIIIKVHNETSLIERANVETTFEALSKYRESLQVSECETEDSARRGVISVVGDGPYVSLIALSEEQGIDDYWEAVNYHYEEYRKIYSRFAYLFDYLRGLSIKNQNAGYTSYDNYWN